MWYREGEVRVGGESEKGNERRNGEEKEGERGRWIGRRERDTDGKVDDIEKASFWGDVFPTRSIYLFIYPYHHPPYPPSSLSSAFLTSHPNSLKALNSLLMNNPPINPSTTPPANPTVLSTISKKDTHARGENHIPTKQARAMNSQRAKWDRRRVRWRCSRAV